MLGLHLQRRIFKRKSRSKKMKKTLIESAQINVKSAKLASLPKKRMNVRRLTGDKTPRRKTLKSNYSRGSSHFNGPKTPKRRRPASRSKGKKNESKGFFGNLVQVFDRIICCKEREGYNSSNLDLFREDK